MAKSNKKQSKVVVNADTAALRDQLNILADSAQAIGLDVTVTAERIRKVAAGIERIRKVAAGIEHEAKRVAAKADREAKKAEREAAAEKRQAAKADKLRAQMTRLMDAAKKIGVKL